MRGFSKKWVSELCKGAIREVFIGRPLSVIERLPLINRVTPSHEHDKICFFFCLDNKNRLPIQVSVSCIKFFYIFNCIMHIMLYYSIVLCCIAVVFTNCPPAVTAFNSTVVSECRESIQLVRNTNTLSSNSN